MFLVDENVPPKIVEFLRSKNYKVKYAGEVGLSGAPDDEVIAYALKEGLAIVSFDKHFANILLYPPSAYSGIIRINIHPPVLKDVIAAFEEFFKKFDVSDIRGALIILERDGFRVKR